MTVAYAWAPITKSEVNDDGTLTVYGPAASSALDRDHQRLDGDWLDQAMPRWLAEGGGVREQHDPKRAVGVGVGLSKGDDGSHYLTAKIVDPVAVKKIEHGVLRGFSVGIKNPRVEMGKADAPKGLVVDGDVIEVSVVDRPANPGCMFALAKADAAGDLELVDDAEVVEKAETFGLPTELYERLAAPVKDALAELAASGASVTAEAAKADAASDEAPVVVNVSVQAPEIAKADLSAAGRKKAAASGAAMKDGSYPIQTKADLRKAIRAVGRGNADHSAIRKHIIKRARALGLEAMVPDNWNSDGSLKDTAKAEEILRDVRALVPALTKADGDEGGTPDESQDIASAQDAIAVIARLIVAEAESLAQGNLNEACDIDLLLSAVRSLTWFQQREEAEQNGDADMSLSEQPDTAKTDETPDEPAATGATAQEPAEGGPAPAEAPAAETSAPAEEQTADNGQPADDGTQDTDTDATDGTGGSESDAVTKAVVAELVKAAVAEVKEASEERTKALEAELAKAQQAIEEFRAMPTLGGPALTRTAAQQVQAKNSDADRMRAEAKALQLKADQVSDRDLRDGYRERAKALLAKADA